LYEKKELWFKTLELLLADKPEILRSYIRWNGDPSDLENCIYKQDAYNWICKTFTTLQQKMN
jgi:hypothetical protein